MGITSLVKSKQAKCGFSSFWRLFWLWLHSPTPNPAPPEQATCAHVSQPLAAVSASELVAGLLLDVWMGLLLGLGPTGLGHVLGRGTMLETAMGVRLTLRVRRPTCAETTRPTRAGALITPSVGSAVCLAGLRRVWVETLLGRTTARCSVPGRGPTARRPSARWLLPRPLAGLSLLSASPSFSSASSLSGGASVAATGGRPPTTSGASARRRPAATGSSASTPTTHSRLPTEREMASRPRPSASPLASPTRPLLPAPTSTGSRR